MNGATVACDRIWFAATPRDTRPRPHALPHLLVPFFDRGQEI